MDAWFADAGNIFRFDYQPWLYRPRHFSQKLAVTYTGSITLLWGL